MKNKILVIICLTLLNNGLAFAGNFDSQFYAGIGIGYSSNKGNYTDFDDSREESNMFENKLNHNHASAKFMFGYMHRIQNTNFTLSLEPFLEYCSLESSIQYKNTTEDKLIETSDSSFKMDWGIGILLKPGYIINDKFMIYGILGKKKSRLKFSRIGNSYDSVENENDYDATLNSHKNVYGFIYGFGVDYAIYTNQRLGLEFTKTKYKSQSVSVLDESKENTYTLSAIDPSNWNISITYKIALF